MKRFVSCIVFAACTATSAFAHEGGAHPVRRFDPARIEQTAFGEEGDPRKVSRSIRVEMDDRMRFEPSDIRVKRGETVRFTLHNRGAVLHEMVLGTAEALAKHAELMKKFPGMVHDDPAMAHVQPGRRGEIVWRFTKPGRYQFACLVPGHYEAGMTGTITVE